MQESRGSTMIFPILFLVSSCKFFASVESNHVESYASMGVINQIFYKYHLDEGTTPVEVELKSESGNTVYKVKCRVYPDEDTKVDIHTAEGLRLETLFLDNVDNPCEEKKLQNYILPGAKKANGQQEIHEITYLWSDKKARCVERGYRPYDDNELAVVVWKYGSERTPCPKKVNEFFESFTGGKKAGGVVALSPTGKIEEMEYTPHVPVMTTEIMEFETKDLKGKSFKLICQKGTVQKSEGASGHQQITALLVHEDNPSMYIDKFKLTSCKTAYLNANRQIFNGFNNFKVVFGHKSGECFEREYDIFGMKSSFYYEKVTIYRRAETKVKCPKSYVGDINLNADQPWYKTFVLFSLFFPKPKEYGRVIYPVED